MASQFLFSVLLSVYLHWTVIASNTTSVGFYTDGKCQDLNITVQTDTNYWNGSCGELNGINSVNPSIINPNCAVSTYIGPYCSNNATIVLVDECRNGAIGSYSVDCPVTNGTLEDYTTISAASGKTAKQSPTPSTSSNPSSLQESLSAIQTSVPSSTTSSSSSQTTTSSSSPESLSSSSTDLDPTSSFPPSSTPSSSSVQTPKGGGNNSGLSKTTIIVLAVVLPAGVALIFGVFVVKRSRSDGPAPQNSGATSLQVSQGQRSHSTTDTSVVTMGDVPQSEQAPTNTRFPSLPGHRQPGLF